MEVWLLPWCLLVLVAPGPLAESVERGPRVCEIGNSIPGRVKAMNKELYLLLPSQTLGSIRIGQGLVGSVLV